MITLDDSTNKITELIDTAIVCSAIDGRFSNGRTLTLRFHRSRIELDPSGEVTSKSIPGVILATLSDQQKEIPLLHRKTLVPTGQTMNQGRLVQGIISLYHASVATYEAEKAAKAAEAAAAAEAPAEPL